LTIIILPVSMAQESLVGQGLLIVEASRSHSNTLHSVGPLSTADEPDVETSNYTMPYGNLSDPTVSIYLLYNFSSTTPVTGSQSVFHISAGLLVLQVLDSSASSIFPLPFPILFWVIFFFFFIPTTRSVFASLICYLPCVIHNMLSSILSRILCATRIFSNYLVFYFQYVECSCRSCTKINFLVLNRCFKSVTHSPDFTTVASYFFTVFKISGILHLYILIVSLYELPKGGHIQSFPHKVS
jgi:hypothetical protein